MRRKIIIQVRYRAHNPWRQPVTHSNKAAWPPAPLFFHIHLSAILEQGMCMMWKHAAWSCKQMDYLSLFHYSLECIWSSGGGQPPRLKSFDDLSHIMPWYENFLDSPDSTVGFPLISRRINQLHSFSCGSGSPAQLWPKLFHKKRKGVPAEQVVSGQEGVAACKEEAQEAEASKCQVSIRHALFQLNHSGVTFQVQRRLCNKHSSRALESAGITECCSKVTLNIGPCVFRKKEPEKSAFRYWTGKRCVEQRALTSDCSSKAKDLKWMCVLAILTSVDRNTEGHRD